MGGNQFASSGVNEVRFPGLFKDLVLVLKKQAFSIGSFTIYWYGVIISIGIIGAFLYFYNRSKRTEKLPENDVLNVTLLCIPIGVICARLLYVVTNLDEYTTFSSIIAINNGGLAIYGGIIGGMATILIYCRVKKIPVLKVLDSAAPAVMLGQLIGRWGNFVNCEAYGYLENDSVLPKLPWRMQITNPDTGFSLTVHPTFLYESLWNLIGFIIINVIYRKKKFDGQIFVLYIGWYGLGRGFIEFLRADSLLIFGQKMFVYLGFGFFILALILYFVFKNRKAKEPDELEEYRKAYASASAPVSVKAADETAEEKQDAGAEKEEGKETEDTVEDIPENNEEDTAGGVEKDGDNT